MLTSWLAISGVVMLTSCRSGRTTNFRSREPSARLSAAANDPNLWNDSTKAQALLKGGVHRVYIGNLKAGDHELLALFTGQGPHVRDYRRGATIKLTKGVGAKYVELKNVAVKKKLASFAG